MRSARPAPASLALRSELTAAGDGLADNEDVLRSVLAGCGDCIKILDLDGRLQFMSEGGKRVMEVDDFGAAQRLSVAGLLGRRRQRRRAARRGSWRRPANGRFKGPANTAKGTPRYWDVQVSPIIGADGKPSHLLSISRDITDEWRAVTELKSSSIARKCCRPNCSTASRTHWRWSAPSPTRPCSGDSVANAREVFCGAPDDPEPRPRPADPNQLGQRADPRRRRRRAGGRTEPAGTDQRHRPRSASDRQAGPGACRSRSTNSRPTPPSTAHCRTGALSIAWTDRPATALQPSVLSGPKAADLWWTEPKKKGFGSRLIEKMLPNDFGGEVRTHYRPDGVVCELTSPLGRLNSDG